MGGNKKIVTINEIFQNKASFIWYTSPSWPSQTALLHRCTSKNERFTGHPAFSRASRRNLTIGAFLLMSSSSDSHFSGVIPSRALRAWREVGGSLSVLEVTCPPARLVQWRWEKI